MAASRLHTQSHMGLRGQPVQPIPTTIPSQKPPWETLITSGVPGPRWGSEETRLRCCRVVMPVPSAIWAGCMLARRRVSRGSPVFISSSVMVPRLREGCVGCKKSQWAGPNLETEQACPQSSLPWPGLWSSWSLPVIFSTYTLHNGQRGAVPGRPLSTCPPSDFTLRSLLGM